MFYSQPPDRLHSAKRPMVRAMTKLLLTRHPLLDLATVVCFVLLALGISLLFENYTLYARFIFFWGAVVLSAWRGGFFSGMSAAVLSVVVVDLVFVPTVGQLFTRPREFPLYLIFLSVALLICYLQETRLRSLADLMQAREQLDIILRGAGDAITAINEHGKVLYANDAAAYLMGFEDVEELMRWQVEGAGSHQRFTIYNEDGEQLAIEDYPNRRALRTGNIEEAKLRMHNTETNATHWVRVRATPVFGADHKTRMAVVITHDITQQRTHDEWERERREHLQRIIDNLPFVVWVMTPEGIITDINETARQAKALLGEQILDMPLTHWAKTEADRQLATAAIQRTQKGAIARYDIDQHDEQGKLLHTFDFTLSPLRDSSGAIISLIGTITDVTERKRLEEVQRENRDYLQQLIDNVPVNIWVLTPDGIITDINRHLVNDRALEPRDVIGTPIYQWYSAESNALVREAVTCARQGEKQRFDLQRVGMDGQQRTVDFSISPLQDAQGNITRLLAATVDITERKRVQDELVRLTELLDAQRQRLRNIITNIPGIIWEATGEPDGSQHVDFVSDYAVTMLGYPVETWYTETIWKQIIHPADFMTSVERSQEIYASGTSGVLQFRCVAADGRVVHVETHTTIIKDAGGQPVGACGLIMDITQRKEAEEALEQYSRDLKRSNEELQQFAYIASHDLQEPLRMVTSYLQLIEERYKDQLDQDAHDFINFAVDGAMRMKALIKDLLAYSRVQSQVIEFEQLNAGEALTEAIDNLQLTIEENNATILVDQLPTIYGDQHQIIQLFQNLLSNAIKFRREAPPQIHVRAEQRDHEWVFSMQDNGIGIEPEYTKRLFTIFQRLHSKERYPGTGIGLAICKKVIERHGGQIWFTSTPGEGTTFYFTLPVTRRKLRESLHGSN